jgi:hypothetical protein
MPEIAGRFTTDINAYSGTLRRSFFAETARLAMKHIYTPRLKPKNNAVLIKTKFYEFVQRRSDRPGHGKQTDGTFGKAARRTRRE